MGPIGTGVADVFKNMPSPDNTFIFGLNYQISSELAFYVPGHPYTVSINRWSRPNVYEYWWQDSDLLGLDAVGCISNHFDKLKLLEVFDRVEVARSL